MLYKKWKRERKRGELPAAIQGPTFLLRLPDEESFGDFTVSRYPASVGETEEQLVHLVEQAELLLRRFAQDTGRCRAWIEKGTLFACDDGRRIPLRQCAYRALRTDADYATIVNAKKKRGLGAPGTSLLQ